MGARQDRGLLKVLNDHDLAHDDLYLTGKELTIVDFLSAEIITCTDLIGVKRDR